MLVAWFPQRRARTVAVAVIALTTLVVAARPARAWRSAAVTVSSPHDAIGSLQLAAGPAGDLLAWKSTDAIEPNGSFGPTTPHVAVAAPGDVFDAERQLPSSYASGPLVDLGGGRVAQLIFVPRSTNIDRIRVALGHTDGSLLTCAQRHGTFDVRPPRHPPRGDRSR